MNVQELDAEVIRRADDLTPELLPQLLERLLARDGLVHCERHGRKLITYVRWQITLTKTKRNYYRDDGYGTESSGYYPDSKITSRSIYESTLRARDDVRKDYRSTPCTCWVQHR